MKTLLTLFVICIAVSGCQEKRQRGLNELKGEHQDRINYHRESIDYINPQIHAQNQKIIPMINDQHGDTTSWQVRMGERMSGMKRGR